MKILYTLMFLGFFIAKGVLAQTGQYEIAFDIELWDSTDDKSSHKCDNYYEIYAIFGNTFPKTVDEFYNLPSSAKGTVTSRQNVLHEGPKHEFWKHSYRYNSSKKLLGFYIRGIRHWSNIWGCKRDNDIHNLVQISNSQCFERTYYSSSGFIPQWASIVKLSVKPVVNRISTSTGKNIPYESSFDITADMPSNYTGTIRWQYQLYGDTGGEGWKYLNYTTGKQGINVSTLNFLKPTDVNKNVAFKAIICGNEYETGTYSIVRYAPKISNIATTPPQCFDSGDGTVTLQFNRSFDADEVVSLELMKADMDNCADNPYYCEQVEISENDLSGLNYTFSGRFDGVLIEEGTQYRIVVTQKGSYSDANNGDYSQVFTIGSVDTLKYTYEHTNLTCFEANDGKVQFSAEGGNPPYSYSLSLEGTTISAGDFTSNTVFDNLAPGVYSLNITDANDCTPFNGSSSLIEILSPTQVVVNLANEIVHPSETNGQDGEVTFLVSGGTSVDREYSYSLTPNAGSIDAHISSTGHKISLSDLLKGNYLFEVQDDNGCLASATFSLYDPLIIESISKTDVECYGENTGTLETLVSGGKEPYSYYWHDSTLVSGTYIHSTEKVRTQLYAGDYSVTVSDENGWETTQSITIIQPQVLGISSDVTEPCIAGENTGAITWTVSGGTPPYRCRNGSGNVLTPVSNGVYEYKNLPAGTYSLRVTDNNGCTISQQIVISDPPVLRISISQTPISCNNTGDGIVVASPYGGRRPYNLQWEYDNGNGWTTISETGNKINNCQPGDYRVTVTDRCGASATSRAITLINPDVPEIELINSKNNFCYGGAEGAITLNVSGGTTPYSYLWSDGSTTKNRTTLSAGEYTLTVSDAHNCTVTGNYSITGPASALSLKTDIEHTWGIGSSDGKLTVTTSGGTAFSDGSYSISVEKGAETCLPAETGFSGGSYSALYDSLAAGEYTIVVCDSSYSLSADAGGCTAQTTVTIIDPTPIAVSVNINKPITCNGDSDASLFATASGGRYNTPKTYNYQWYKLVDTTFVPISYTEQLTGDLDSGIYKVTATDEANLVGESSPIEIVMPEVLEASYTKSDVSCYGGNNGKINVTISGGVTPYKSTWNNGATSQNIFSLPIGVYSDTITDANGCSIVIGPVEITQPGPIEVTVSSFGPITIGGNDANVEITVQGGTPFANGTYSAIWTNETNSVMPLAGDTVINGVYKAFYENWTEGTYTLTVSDTMATTTGDNIGCIFTRQITLTDPLPIQINIEQQDEILCYAEETASIVAAVSEGVPYPGGGYLYQWYSIDNSGIASPVNDTDTLAGSLPAGNYFLEVTDYVGKHYSDTITISEPALLQASISSSNVKCYDGSDGTAAITISGGVAPYQIKWNTGESAAILSNLEAGNYYANITDANNCTTTAYVEISQPDNPLTIYYNEISNPLAAGSSDGYIDITVKGGTPPYEYSWTDSTSSIIATSEDISGLARGTYAVMVTDNNYDGTGTNGCTATETVFLIDPKPIIISISQTDDVVCWGEATGEITSVVTGGVKVANIGYYYNWFRLDENGGSQDIGQTNKPVASQLSAGTYVLKITDYNGIEVWSDTIEITQPEKLQVSGTSSNVFCHNGSDGFIQTNANGGTLPLTYLWENGETESERNNLTAGNYHVTVSDANACDTTLYFYISQPEAPLKITVDKITRPLAYGYSDGAIDITVEGGTLPYLFRWTDEKGNKIADTEDISGIPAGLYTIIVEDNSFALTTGNAGCTISRQIRVNQPDPLEVEINEVASVQCFGEAEGVLQTEITGGVTFNTGDEYLIKWFIQTGESWTAIDENALSVYNLITGTYKVIVEDANGITNSVNYVLGQPDLLNLTINVIDAGCENGNDGEIEALVSGGTAPYFYQWNNGATTASQNGIASGGYFVFVTDKNGCEIYGGARVEQPGGLSASVTIENTSCNNACNGSAVITVEGGVPPYNYTWSSPEYSGDSANGLCAGSYSVEITDQNGCRTVPVFEITEPSPMVLDLVESVTLCEGQSYDAIVLAQTEGTSYYWESANGFTATTRMATLTDAGIYTITATNPEGCTASASIEVERANDLLDPDFVITTQAFTDNEIVLVNTTTPMPGNVTWDLPNEASIIEETMEQVRLIFYQEGSYELGMIVQEGECTFELYKDLLVTTQEDMDDIGDAEDPFISEFLVYPNPSDGRFTAKVVLKETAPIVLKLYTTKGNGLIFRHELKGQSAYEHTVNVSLAAGSYIVLLETAEGTKFKQIIIL